MTHQRFKAALRVHFIILITCLEIAAAIQIVRGILAK